MLLGPVVALSGILVVLALCAEAFPPQADGYVDVGNASAVKSVVWHIVLLKVIANGLSGLGGGIVGDGRRIVDGHLALVDVGDDVVPVSLAAGMSLLCFRSYGL
ncbi:uncharacterized protein BDR25DRAFT_303801 [Lindgomyces ingoldianus]|uniref:Uncharacterized protein n=1 Tax=Lindgomyces ingoldianus TaxID=673940 RepID=A0ACB6QTB1_9PLEO|nr:uncharacterized protein BDR25DRAFT_303801 [Lindgomyces ingoldianus]KAF2470253.1 hypothetical protein BDR25DRAFT_303801 [Lindgomyces ingoldianus]